MEGDRRTLALDVPGEAVVRRAREADAADIAAVYRAAYPEGTDYPLVAERAVRTALLDDGNTAPFVVEAGGDVVAAAAIEYDSLDEGNAQICKLAVDPSHQGRGVGRALLDHRLRVLERDDDFSGLVYAAAVTAHPASQRNLVSQGFAPFSLHKRVRGEYFGTQGESEVILLYTDSVEYDERTVYVPDRYRHLVERVLAQASLDLLGRSIELTEGLSHAAVDRTRVRAELQHSREFLWEVTAFGEDTWAETEAEILSAMHSEEAPMMVPVDANSPELGVLYAALEHEGFDPAGFVPDWLTRDGENRDAFVFQHPVDDTPAEMQVVPEVKGLVDALGIDYRVRAEHDRYWTLEL
jgi:GNAT superfamily N-acetyltransferase